MIDFYTYTTPNGRKISIMLEETGLAYQPHLVNITKNEQFTPEFLAISPNNKIPVIVDSDGPGGQKLTLFESGAILIYLAEKTGQFLPQEPAQRAIALQWLMFQMGGLGPMLGQLHHFLRFAPEKVPYGIERFSTEAKRLYGVMNKHLASTDYFAGSYSIADMAIYPWVARHGWQEIDLAAYPNVDGWFQRVGNRPAVQKAMAAPY
jgi:GST-like protein